MGPINKDETAKRIVEGLDEIKQLYDNQKNTDLNRNEIITVVTKKNNKINPNDIYRSYQLVNGSATTSISLKKLTKLLKTVNSLRQFSPDQLVDFMYSCLNDSSNSIHISTRRTQLESFIGKYCSYIPNLQGKDAIIDGELILSLRERGKNQLNAVFRSLDKSFEGVCVLKSSCLFIALKNQEEEIYLVTKVGLRNEQSYLIATSCSVNDNSEPVAFIRILIPEHHFGVKQDPIKEYLLRENTLIIAPNWDEFKTANEENRINEKLKILDGLTYISYNMFSFQNSPFEVYENVWEFKIKKGMLRVRRKGAYDKVFTGSVDYGKSHLFIYLYNEKMNHEKRLYIMDIPSDFDQGDVPEILEIIGLGLNLRSKEVAGKEFLIRSDRDYKEVDGRVLSLNVLDEINSKIVPFLQNRENATFLIDSYQIELPASIDGYYQVYYLHSETGRLTRNRAQFFSTNTLKGRVSWLIYETRDLTYDTIRMHYSENKLFIKFKDNSQDMYFAFHMQYLPLDFGQKTQMLFGTTSCISHKLQYPKATPIIFHRIDEQKYQKRTLGLINISEYNEDEQLLKTYLDFITANPLNIYPYRSLTHLKEDINHIKKQYLNRFSSIINDYMSENLKQTHNGFLNGMVNILSSFVLNEKIKFDQEYIGLFRLYYNDLLRNSINHPTTFYTTSYPKNQYFWHKGNSTEDLIEEFVANGGKMNRLFFVDSESGVPSLSELEIIERHYLNYGKDPNYGAVYVASPNNFEDPFIFSTVDNGYISWKVTCKINKIIEQLEVTTDMNTHEQFRNNFFHFIAHPKTQQVDAHLLEEWNTMSK